MEASLRYQTKFKTNLGSIVKLCPKNTKLIIKATIINKTTLVEIGSYLLEETKDGITSISLDVLSNKFLVLFARDCV